MPRVMILDDDSTMSSLLRTLLQLDGFEPFSGPIGGDVLSNVKAESPDAVLLDVFLAQKDGMEILRGLKHDPETAHIPVVMTSGMDVSEACQGHGAEAFLLKPYSPDQLVEVLHRLTDRRPPSRPDEST